MILLRVKLSRLAIGVAISTAMSVVAFASGFAEQPSKPVMLAGTWELNSALSDDVAKLVAAQREKLREQREREMRRAARNPGFNLYPTEAETLGGGLAQTAPRPELTVERYDRLTIEQSPEHFRIQGDGSSGPSERQSYDPGEQSVVSFGPGVADRQAGWKGRNFMIDTRALSGVRREESYTLDAMNRLVVEIEISGRGPKLKVRQIYDRSKSSSGAPSDSR